MNRKIDEKKNAGQKPVDRFSWEKLLKNRRGQMRIGPVLLAAMLIYAISVPGLELLFRAGFDALMKLWGITSRNLARAPRFVRELTRYSEVILTVLQSGALFALSLLAMQCLRLKKDTKELPRRRNAGVRGATCGTVTLLVLWIILLLVDNMRLGHSLLRPVWSVNTLALSLTSIVFVSAGLFWGLGFVYRFLENRLPWGGTIALGAVALVPVTLTSLHPDPLLIANTLLCGVVCCLSAQKEGGWSWAAGFLSAIWILERAVLGFPGYSAALYETYPVNYAWLNGGENGLWHGAAMTVVMLAHAFRLGRPLLNKAVS